MDLKKMNLIEQEILGALGHVSILPVWKNIVEPN